VAKDSWWRSQSVLAESTLTYALAVLFQPNRSEEAQDDFPACLNEEVLSKWSVCASYGVALASRLGRDIEV
jgi:hypothetical protein